MRFSDERIIREFGQALIDPVTGTCEGTSIEFVRTLRDKKSKHTHSGSLTRDNDGRTEMRGKFRDEDDHVYDWSGRVVDPSPATKSP